MKKRLHNMIAIFLLSTTIMSAACETGNNKLAHNKKEETEKPICADEDDMNAIRTCLEKNIFEKDKQLNDLYQKLMEDLSIEAKEILKQSQLKWIQLKDKEKMLIYSILSDDPKNPSLYGQINALSFYLNRIESRIEDLIKYLEMIELH